MGAFATGVGIAVIVAKVAIFITQGLIPFATQNERQGKFTEELVNRLGNEYPDYRVLVILRPHTFTGPAVTSNAVMKVGGFAPDITYKVYLVHQNDRAVLKYSGDGGWQNWAFRGINIRRDDSSGTLAFDPLPQPAVQPQPAPNVPRLPAYSTFWKSLHGTYLCANQKGVVYLHPKKLAECKWTMINNRPNNFSFKSSSNMYLRGNQNGKVDMAYQNLAWEQWDIVGNNGGVSWRSVHNTFLRGYTTLNIDLAAQKNSWERWTRA